MIYTLKSTYKQGAQDNSFPLQDIQRIFNYSDCIVVWLRYSEEPIEVNYTDATTKNLAHQHLLNKWNDYLINKESK